MYFIDFIGSAIIMAILMMFFIMLPIFLNQNGSSTINTNTIFLRTLLLSYISIIYLVLRDLFGKKSIAKRFLKLKIIDSNTGAIASTKQRLLRNATWILGPVEVIVFMLFKYRIGDKIANTTVVPETNNATL